MEVRELRRLSGGRLVVVAHAMSRFRVLRPTSSSPYPRADVALLPDEEELGLTGLRREAGPTSQLPRQVRAEAARAAAAAASLAWAAAEVDSRSYLAQSEAAEAARVEGREFRGGWRAVADGEGRDIGSSRELEQLAPLNPRLSVRGESVQAAAAAAAAAEATIEFIAASGRPDRSEAGADGEAEGQRGPSDDPISRHLELLADVRGLPVFSGLGQLAADPARSAEGASSWSTSAALAADADNGLPRREPPSRASVQLPSAAFRYSPPFLLALEQAIWTELVQCLQLTQRLAQGDAAAAAVRLPEELLSLIPPPPGQGWPEGMPEVPASAEWLHRWGYPPVRRAQRLSFLIAAALPALLGSVSTPAATGDPLPLASALPTALDRQALLQKTSVRERLQAAVIYLGRRRQQLAAMATLEAALGSGGFPHFDA